MHGIISHDFVDSESCSFSSKNSYNSIPLNFVLGTLYCQVSVLTHIVRAGLINPMEVGKCNDVFPETK